LLATKVRSAVSAHLAARRGHAAARPASSSAKVASVAEYWPKENSKKIIGRIFFSDLGAAVRLGPSRLVHAAHPANF